MEKKNMKEWMGKVMSDTTRIAIPIMTHPGIELSGRKVIDAVTDGEVHAEAIVALNQKYPASASTVIMDLTVEAEAFGAEVVFPEDEVPSVTGRLLHTIRRSKLFRSHHSMVPGFRNTSKPIRWWLK